MRTSHTAWLKKEEHEHIHRIYRRVSDITGLNMENSEPLQVSSYGIGGHYSPHYDAHAKGAGYAYREGNRIATWLMYASDVELGGATVFPESEVTIFPRKGSAAFWYNLQRNGERDHSTFHGACPVLIGTKHG